MTKFSLYATIQHDLSVSLKLSNYATIKAAENYVNTFNATNSSKDDSSVADGMIRLGGKNKENNVYHNGTNYFVDGGIIDCNGVANGVNNWTDYCLESDIVAI